MKLIAVLTITVAALIAVNGAPGAKGRKPFEYGSGKKGSINSPAIQARLNKINANAARKAGIKLDKDEDVRELIRGKGKAMKEKIHERAGGKFSIAEANLDSQDELVFGDVAPTDDILDMLEEGSSRRKRYSTTIVGSDLRPWFLWPDYPNTQVFKADGTQVSPIIPYDTSKAPPRTIDNIRKVAEHWFAKETCVRFVNITDKSPKPSDYIMIKDGGAGQCWSYIGRIGGVQELSLGAGCETEVVIAHEFTHALGFYHEHSRPDRDDYLYVLTENIETSRSSFDKVPAPPESNGYGVPYNVKSIMQYPSYAFAKQGLNSIITKPGNETIEYNNDWQFTDIKIINLMYCSDVCKNSATKCYKDGYPDPNNCNQCKCPPNVDCNQP
jgi:hypothetical protein